MIYIIRDVFIALELSISQDLTTCTQNIFKFKEIVLLTNRLFPKTNKITLVSNF